jgi:uncharacterized membrane protein YdjX (TVP38/TMEM64 family)
MSIEIIKRWLPLLIIGGFMAAAYALGLHEQISLKLLQDNKEELLSAVAEHQIITALIFIATYIVFVALSLPAATLLTLSGGFLFGTWLGTLYTVMGATIGATILFYIAKTSLGAALREKAGGLYKRVEGNMKENAVGYLMFMRLVPVFPFFLVNIVPALFNVKPRIFILTTFFGIMPGSFVFVNLGKQLATIESLNDLASTQTLLAFALLGFFALIPTLYKQFKKRNAAAALSALAIIAFPHAGYAGDEGRNKFLTAYDGLLKTYVQPVHDQAIAYNGVDYDGWGADPRHQEALKHFFTENPDDYTGEAKKSFWINAYNFLTIDLILRENERESIKNLGGVFTSPWKKHSWTIAQQDYTLDEIEHKILRPMNDARIHFAINCASISCPDLRAESYRADTLTAQLNQQVSLTLDNTGKGFDQTDGIIYVSKIFEWFAADFNKGAIKAWLGDYKQINQNDDMKFMDYDWSLNSTKNKAE